MLVGQDGTLDGSSPFVGNPAGLGITPTGPASDFFVDALLAYDGAGMLSLTYTPSNGAGTFTAAHAIDVSSVGSTVRLGFTASSGAASPLAEVDDWTFTGLGQTTTATPEPGTTPLVATGLLLLVGTVRRRRA
ncbi:MAG: PEP-CTERM sorting domain-containing protein [Gemmatimonadaceae bacterium]